MNSVMFFKKDLSRDGPNLPLFRFLLVPRRYRACLKQADCQSANLAPQLAFMQELYVWLGLQFGKSKRATVHKPQVRKL